MEPITRESANALLIEFYGDIEAQEDPEWWEEMIQTLLEQKTIAAAKMWLE